MTKQLIKNILSEILFGNKICESMFQQNDVDFLYNELLLERLLIGEPVSLPELKTILNKKILNFEFIKKNGEVRPARGTTIMKYIPKEDHPDGMHPSSDKVAAFYDLDKKAWRSVSNKSREIILDKDESTGNPKVVVSNKKPKEEPKQGEMVKGKDGKEIRPLPTPIKPIVKPSIVPSVKPEIPKPEDINIPGREENPLDILDQTKVADEVKDQEIIAPKEIVKPSITKEPKQEDEEVVDEPVESEEDYIEIVKKAANKDEEDSEEVEDEENSPIRIT